jgi:hypothetical protein
MLMSLYGRLIPPAIERTHLHNLGPIRIFFLSGPVYDLISHRRIHSAYLWSLLFIVALFIPTWIAIGSTQTWHHFVDWVIQ